MKVPEKQNGDYGEKDESDNDESDDDFQGNEDDENLCSIEGRLGKFKETITVHQRYAARPKKQNDMCLAQFASHYSYTKRIPKEVTFYEDGSSKIESSKVLFCDIGKEEDEQRKIPLYLDMSDKKLGKMRLRKQPAVLRLHDSRRKEGHEHFYAEMLLYYPWTDECGQLCPGDAQDCAKLFHQRIGVIDKNKRGIFPNIDTMDHLLNLDEYSAELNLQRPSHILEILDTQREQEKSEDQDVGVEDDPQFAARDPIGVPFEEKNFEEFKYKQMSLPQEVDLLQLTRNLVPEQIEILEKIVEHCKLLHKYRNQLEVTIPGLLAIIHGGAGVGKSFTIRAISLWAEKLLRKPGHNPNYPRVLICAPTGKAASIISKYKFVLLILKQFV